MSLFVTSDFVSASGAVLPWKIECDQLLPADWATLATIIASRVGFFSSVEGVPTGGLQLAAELERFTDERGPLLIVDDVLTTGMSMERHRDDREAIGVVAFARGPYPSWVRPLWMLGEPWRSWEILESRATVPMPHCHSY